MSAYLESVSTSWNYSQDGMKYGYLYIRLRTDNEDITKRKFSSVVKTNRNEYYSTYL